MRKILFITAFAPCNATAGQAYSERLISQLRDDGSHVDTYSYYNDYQDPRLSINYDSFIKLIEVNLLFRLFCCIIAFFVHPVYSSRFSFFHMLELRRIAGDYDCLYFDFSQVFIYSLFISHPNKVLMAHDVVSQKYKREVKGPISKLNYLWSEACESVLLRSANSILTFSKKDSNLLRLLFNVDSSEVPFFIDKQIEKETPQKNEKEFFVFYGSWGRKENLDSLKYFFEKFPQFANKYHFKIVGGGLSSAKLNEYLGDNISYEYLGFVDNPYKVLSLSSGLVAPLRLGAGVKVKVIESLGCGVPVIGTDVAFEGIPDYAKSFCLYVDSEDSFIKASNFSNEDRVKFKQDFLAKYTFSHPLRS